MRVINTFYIGTYPGAKLLLPKGCVILNLVVDNMGARVNAMDGPFVKDWEEFEVTCVVTSAFLKDDDWKHLGSVEDSHFFYRSIPA